MNDNTYIQILETNTMPNNGRYDKNYHKMGTGTNISNIK